MASAVADTCWVTGHVFIQMQFTLAGLMEDSIGLGVWGGTLYGPPSGIIRTLGWCTGVTREANNSVVRLPGFESWLIRLLAVWF